MWPFGGKPSKARQIIVRAKYDAAATTYENRKHWQNADNFSALGAITPEVRRILRSRARYEIANNTYAKGIVLTLANDVIGTGPRLQMLTNAPAANSIIEAEFQSWATAINLAGKLRTMRMARSEDGEAFALMFTNERLSGPVKLDLQLIEADQVASPQFGFTNLNEQPNDGIVFDTDGNPVSYQVLTTHPGDPVAMTSTARTIPAAYMIHWFLHERPGQTRGVSELTPALPLFGMLRRYSLSVLLASETAANLGVIMSTTSPAGGEAAEVDPTTEMELARNTALFTPEGWVPTQLKAEQPTNTYPAAKGEFLDEIGRCFNMPSNMVKGNSSNYNYASGRMDHQTYFRSIRVDQTDCGLVVLDRILSAWLAEAVTVLDELPALEQTGHQWFWPGTEHVDPAKEAAAQEKRLSSKTTTYAAEYAKDGKDWEKEFEQIAKEQALMAKLGISAPPPPAAAKPGDEKTQEQEDEDEQEIEDEEKQARAKAARGH